MAEDADARLVARCLDGDMAAFDQLIERYQKPLYNGCLRLVGSAEDAQDTLQTVFLKAYQKLETFDRERRFFSWIYKMMVNEALNSIARRKQFEELSPNLAAPGGSPEELFAQSRLSDRVQDALMTLKPDYRAVIVLKYFGDLSYRELSYVFDVPLKTVKSRLYAARQKLGALIAAEGIASHG
jgi:RNA polymerase sigma-70 factor (ECF subfamily)